MSINIHIERKDDIIRYVNLALESCLKNSIDKNNLKFDIIELRKGDSPITDDSFGLIMSETGDIFKTNYGEYDMDEYFVALFVLKRMDLINKQQLVNTNGVVSYIITYVIVKDNKISYSLHSYTDEQFRGHKYNQILRSVFVISSKYIKVNGKLVDEIGSQAASPISGYIWENKFRLQPSSPKTVIVKSDTYINLVGHARSKLAGTGMFDKLRRKKVYKKLKASGVIKLDLQTDTDIRN